MLDKILLVLAALFIILYRLLFTEPTPENIRMMGILGWVLLVSSMFTWLKRGNRLVSPYMVFLVVLYLFSFGTPLLYAFSVTPENDLLGFLEINRRGIYESEWLTLLMLISFHLGALVYTDKKKNVRHIKDINNFISNKRLARIGWLLFIISIYFYVSETINNLVYSVLYGYAALFEREDSTGLGHLTNFFSELFIPSVICLYIAYKDNKLIRYSITTLLLLNIGAIFVIGGRSNGVILLAILLILRDSLIKHFSKKEYLGLAIGGLILLSFFSYTATTRNEGGRSFDIKTLEIDDNTIVKAIAEMGGSQSCLIKTMEFVPKQEDFRYGRTYLFAFTTIIPNLGFWEIHPAKKEANMSDWLTDKLGLSYGTGFSMCAEAYINFGYLGPIVFFLFGLLFARIFGSIELSINIKDYAKLAFLLIIFWFALKLPRNNFIGMVRPFFYYAGPIYLYCKYGKKKMIVKKKNDTELL